MQLVRSAKYGLLGRPDTCDEMVMGEIDRSYRQLTIKPDDVVFDIGGNIGAFAAWAAPKCKQVITFEPDADNFAVLTQNIAPFNNVTAYNCALVGHNNPTVEFFTNDTGRNKGLHSLVVTGGRTRHVVQAQNFAAMLNTYRPTVIKMDIEGGEVDLLLGKSLPEHVREIALELHLQKKIWREVQIPQIIRELEAQFANIKRRAFVDSKNRATLGIYSR